MVTKNEATKELHNLGEQQEFLKGRDLKVFATIMGRRATCPGIVGSRKNLSKAMWQPPKRRWRMNDMQRYYVS